MIVRGITVLMLGLIGLANPGSVQAELPGTAYIFPAGGQRGKTVNVRIGGHFLHDKAEFLLGGHGLEGSSHVERTKTIWFEGPLILQPSSQQKEDYPKDYSAQIKVAADSPLGYRVWHCATSQGITPGMRFIVGDLPEIVEEESDSSRAATLVTLPVTVNGRIFPREDVDDWSFEAKANHVITCEVNAARFGSGLDSRLEVLDSQGQILAENSDAIGADSFVRFTAPHDGKYIVRIHDIRFEGLQHYVYRLTISAGAWLDHVYPLGGRRGTRVPLQLSGANLPSDRFELAIPAAAGSAAGVETIRIAVPPESDATTQLFETDDLPEHLEAEPNDDPAQTAKLDMPAVLNGRIDRAGDADHWALVGKKGETWKFDLRASQLGSELDGVLTLLDEKGSTIGAADDSANGVTDCVLTATLPADGIFTLKVEEKISSRGGTAFAYRVRVTSAKDSSLRLTTPLDAVTLLRGGEVRLKVLADRPPGFVDEVDLKIEGLPDGVTSANPPKLGKGQNQFDVVLKADATAKIVTSRLRIVGQWKVGDVAHSTEAVINDPKTAGQGLAQGEAAPREILLRVGLPTPFKLKAVFESKYAPRGSVFQRKFLVERKDFTGPLWTELADRQARHLQGVTGPKMLLAADQTEFDYPFTLPPWMEVGRTSRTCVAVFGEVVEPDGSRHVVSHTSQNQDDQAIVIVEPNRLSLEASQSTVRLVAGATARLSVRVTRGNGLRGPVRVAAQDNELGRGISVDPLELPDGASTGELNLRFSADAALQQSQIGLKLKASMLDERGFPITDEVIVKVVDVE